MFGSKSLKVVALAGVIALLGAGKARAVAQPLAPGGTVTPVAGTVSGGTTIAANSPQSYSTGGGTDIAGIAGASVYQEAGGTLDFLYQVEETGGSDFVAQVNVGQFGGFTITDATYVANAGQIAPTSIVRGANGNTVSFLFNPATGIPNGSESDLLVLRTNATNYTAGLFSVQDTLTANLVGFEPAAAVPEPATAGIALVSLPLLAGFLLLKSRKTARVA